MTHTTTLFDISIVCKTRLRIAFQAGRVAHDDDGVRFAKTDEVARNLFFSGMRHERICAGNIDQDVSVFLAGAVPLRIGYRFAGPVTGMLVKAGQRVKYGAFSDIRIAREGNDFIVRVLSFDFQARIHGLQADRAVCQTHPKSPFQRASMRMPLQSSERIAMTAPRIRYADGSPPGLVPMHSTSVFSIRPMSSSRRRHASARPQFAYNGALAGFYIV